MILTNVGKLNYLTVKTLLNVKGYVDNENFLFQLFSLTLPYRLTPTSLRSSPLSALWAKRGF